MWSVWSVFCNCDFHSVCPLMDKDKRLVEASWWKRLIVGESGSCSDRRGHAQYIFNSIFYWWVGLCSLSVVCLRPNYGRGNSGNASLLQKDFWPHCCIQFPNPAADHCWPTPLPETPELSQASLVQSFVGTLLLSLGPGVHRFCLCPPRVSFPSLGEVL